ncbi:MAG: hypothetical protein LBR79_01290 [Oscillospiraceae bacterium]|nr:hypothetical protein [Oscillospiraceae bacterium]
MKLLLFPPPMAGEKILSTNLGHNLKCSCYDLKQPSKVNLSVYFLPAVGREKVIKIRCFSNKTSIVETSSFSPATLAVVVQIN